MTNETEAPASVGLLPCPFCGGEPREFVEHDDSATPLSSATSIAVNVTSARSFHGVGCHKCDVIQSNPFSSRENAIAAWNKRANLTPEAPVSGDVERVGSLSTAREMLALEYDQMGLSSEAKRLRVHLGCELSAEKAALTVIGRLAYLEEYAGLAGLPSALASIPASDKGEGAAAGDQYEERTLSVELAEAANLLDSSGDFDLRDACREAAKRLTLASDAQPPAIAEGMGWHVAGRESHFGPFIAIDGVEHDQVILCHWKNQIQPAYLRLPGQAYIADLLALMDKQGCREVAIIPARHKERVSLTRTQLELLSASPSTDQGGDGR